MTSCSISSPKEAMLFLCLGINNTQPINSQNGMADVPAQACTFRMWISLRHKLSNEA